MAKLREGFKEEALPKKLNFRVWGKIFSYALRHPFLLLGSFLCLLFTTYYDSSFVAVMNASAIKAADSSAFFQATSLFDAPIPADFLFGIHVDFTFYSFLVTMIVMLLVRCLAIFLNFTMTNFVSMKIMLDLRNDTFTKIQRLSFSYFDVNSSGWLIARIQGDTAALGDVIAWSFGMLIWSLFELIFSIATMISVNPLLASISLSLTPIIMLLAPLIEHFVLKAHRIERAAQSYYVAHLSESIDGAKTVKTLALERAQSEQTLLIARDIANKRVKAIKANAYLPPILTLVSGCTTALIIAVGHSGALNHGVALDAATLVLFISLAGQVFEPLQSISEVFSDFFSSQAGAEKVVQLLEAEIEIDDSKEVKDKYGDLLSPKKEAFPVLKGEIDFTHLSFSYHHGGEVLHDISLHIQQGTSVALVGETGSGKTTLANLLCRFYPISKGDIYVDGVNIQKLSLTALRSNIAYVQQTPFLFDRSFFDNIAFGSPDATLEQVQKASQEVGIEEFILDHPGGYDYILEDGGNGISQGQKQLICLARALLKDPAILILDEATSSVDTLTEEKVQKAIAKLLKGRTSIIIAHRLSTIVESDRILVMENGRIIEDGSHEELLQKQGKYASLYASQFDALSLDEQILLSNQL